MRLAVYSSNHFIEKCELSTPKELTKYKDEYRKQKNHKSAAALVSIGTDDDVIANCIRS